jgi:hypothetical protein
MSIDRNGILCALAIASGLLSLSGCGNSDKSAATADSVTASNLNTKPVASEQHWDVSPGQSSSNHGAVLHLTDDESPKAPAPNVYQFQLSEADKPLAKPFNQYTEPVMDTQKIKSTPGTFGTLNGPGLENANK